MIEFKEPQERIEYKELREHMVNDNPLDFELYLQRNIKVKPYISISKRCAYVDIASINLSYRIQEMLDDKVSSLADMCMYIEMEKLFTGMFMYIDVEFDTIYQTYVEYDLIMESGLFNYVMKYAGADYQRFCNDVDIATGIRDMVITETIKKYLHVPTVEEVNMMTKSLEDIDEDKMDKLLRVIEMNSPALKSVVDGAHEQAVKDAISNAQTKVFVAKGKK